MLAASVFCIAFHADIAVLLQCFERGIDGLLAEEKRAAQFGLRKRFFFAQGVEYPAGTVGEAVVKGKR